MTLTLSSQPLLINQAPSRYFKGGHRLRLRSLSGNITYSPCIPRGRKGDDQPSPPMGLSSDLISRKDSSPLQTPPRAPRGSGGLTKINKELLEDGTCALWKYCSGPGRKFNHQAVFLTLTIPTHFESGEMLNQDDINTILTEWPELTKRLFEEISRLQARFHIPTRWQYVIEPQEERWKDTGKFYPHIHAVMLNRWDKTASSGKGFKAGAYLITPQHTDQIWGRLLANLLGDTPDMRAAGNLGTIKGLGGLYSYLTKLGKIARYCSKGSQLIPQIREAGYTLPKSWAGADRDTRKQINESILTVSSELSISQIRERLEQFNQQFEEQSDHSLFSGFWEVMIDGVEFPVSLKFRVYRWSDIPLATAVLDHITE